MRYIITTIFFIVSFTISFGGMASDSIKQVSFSVTDKQIKNDLIVDAIHQEAAVRFGAYFVIRKGESYNGGYGENITFRRPLHISILEYSLAGNTVTATVKVDKVAALEEAKLNYENYLKGIEQAKLKNEKRIVKMCKNIYETLVETYFKTAPLSLNERFELLGGKETFHLLESGEHRTVMEKANCAKAFDNGFVS